MNIYESFQGKNPFKGYTNLFFNLTGFILLFYSLLMLFYGGETYKNTEFIEFLEIKIHDRKKLFSLIFSAKLILLLGACLIITLTAWILFRLNGFAVEIDMFLKIADNNLDYYLLLLKYMHESAVIRKSIFQFFLFLLMPAMDKSVEVLD